VSQAETYLTGVEPRSRWMRLDTAQILKRFFFCERSLLVSEAAWLPLIGSLEIKTELPRFIWQGAQVELKRVANALIEQAGKRPLG